MSNTIHFKYNDDFNNNSAVPVRFVLVQSEEDGKSLIGCDKWPDVLGDTKYYIVMIELYGQRFQPIFQSDWPGARLFIPDARMDERYPWKIGQVDLEE